MKPIANLTFENPFFLAPMEAVNCASFRVLCKKRGAAAVYTDMIDADIFCEFVDKQDKEKAIAKYLNPQKDEHPLFIQVGGSDIQNLTRAIKILQPYADAIDYNVGCPLKYMLAKQGGVFLMKHPDQLYKKVTEMREVTKVPFTVKLRAGWDADTKNAVEVAKELEKLGVDAITIHGRTRKQKYQDKADWSLVKEAKKQLKIPVILSGDVTNAYMADLAFRKTNCDYIMVARGAKVNPSIFSELKEYWKTKKYQNNTSRKYNKTAQQTIQDFEDFVDLYTKREKRFNLSEIKDHAIWSVTGSRDKNIKNKIMDCKEPKDVINLVRHIEFRGV